MGADKSNELKFLALLPTYKAPASIWENIEISLFSVNRSILPSHQPPAGLWGSIEKSYLARKRYYRAALILLLALLLSVPGYYVIHSGKTSQSGQDADKQAEKAVYGDTETSEIYQGKRSDELILKPIQIKKIDLINGELTIQPVVKQNEKSTFSIDNDRSVDLLSYLPGLTSPLNIDHKPSLLHKDDIYECSPFTGSGEIYMGVSYEYQYFFNGNSYLDTEQLYWQSAVFSTRFVFNKVFLEPGVGLTISKDKINWEYDYLQNELINTYEYVDSVHYDPVTGETIYYTTTVEVYDSVSYTRSMTDKHTSYYLRAPLFVGIGLTKSRNFCTKLSAGIVYNILLNNSAKAEIIYDDPNGRVTAIHYDHSLRVTNSFNISLRMNFEWQINSRLVFSIYPSANYYLNQVYKGREGQLPVTLGLGAGLYFK